MGKFCKRAYIQNWREDELAAQLYSRLDGEASTAATWLNIDEQNNNKTLAHHLYEIFEEKKTIEL